MFLDSLLDDAEWQRRYARDRAGQPMPMELVRRGIELESLAGSFELPWAVQELGVHSSDRSGEIRVLLEKCRLASNALAQIDAALTSSTETPYRSN